MRETVEFEFGGFGAGVGSARVGLALAERGVRARAGQQAPRRRATGPRPVRPAAAPVGVRPARCERPGGRIPIDRPGPRVLARHPQPPVVALRFRVRRAVAGVLATLVAVAVVVGLGLIADAVSAARAPEPPRSSVGPVEWPAPVLRVPAG